jgi:rhodanese-related sulfurtransferase
VATAKIDGIFFVLGVIFGIFGFGETVEYFNSFFHSSYMGRFTLPEFFGLDTGWVVLLVVLMALFMFWGAEQLERIVGKKDLSKAPKERYVGAAVLVVLAVGAILIGQPTTEDKWAMLAPEMEARLEERAVQIHPGELLTLIHDDKIKVQMLDVRDEADFNIFHITDAYNTPIDTLPDLIPDFLLEPQNTVFVVMSNHEDLATEAWKTLVAESVPNVYILEGGLNYWLDTFTLAVEEQFELVLHTGEDDLHHVFDAAIGDRHSAADPDPHDFELEYTPKVKLEIKRGPLGSGCG